MTNRELLQELFKSNEARYDSPYAAMSGQLEVFVTDLLELVSAEDKARYTNLIENIIRSNLEDLK